MEDHSRNVLRFKGNPREIGLSLGRALRGKLAINIDKYIRQGPSRAGKVDQEQLKQGALPWLRSLPQRYQDEFEGLALGANVPLQRVAEWGFVEECTTFGCSSAIYRLDGHLWVLRNNDLWAPGMWGFMIIREVTDRIPTISFGLEGEMFVATGVNAKQLWLHYNALPVVDSPSPRKPQMPPFILLTEALETCSTIDDVEALLRKVDRKDGMMIFAVEGKTEHAAIFECACSGFVKRRLFGDYMAGTNHFCSFPGVPVPVDPSPASLRRYNRLTELLDGLKANKDNLKLPGDLITILADPNIEGRGADYGTVYSNIACPAQKKVWYTFGGYPAASAGTWKPVEWPWDH